MNQGLKILFCSSEVAPFSKTGGLGDVSGSLPKALHDAGCDIRVITPKYHGISGSTERLKEIVASSPVKIGERTEEAGLYESTLPDSKVPVYFVSQDKYFDRKGFYQEDGLDYEDNLERFSFFSMAILQTIRETGWQPDVIHCNDWQTALIPVYLKTPMKEHLKLQEFYEDTGTLFTIHNLGYQGLFSGDRFPVTGLKWAIFNIDGLEFYGKINLLKGGILFSDILTTVSPTYCMEIQTEEGGHGLHGALQERSDDLYGILNGIDYNEWDPSIDQNIAARYSLKSISDKKKCKRDLQESCGLTIKDIPTIGIVSRLDDQKGFDILITIIDELMQLDIQLVILGTGKPRYEDILKKFAEKYPEKMSVNLFFNNSLAHKIEAGSDLFLIPSRYEPCGLSQLYSFKYGTVPIAHKTGGLADTITDYIPSNIAAKKVKGFLFSHYSGEDLLKSTLFALSVYKDKREWKRIVSNGMKSDFSWERSASEYVKLYNKIVKKKGGL